MDAKTAKDIMPLRKFSMSDVPKSLNIRVDILECSREVVESVLIDFDGETRCENYSPYAAFGDKSTKNVASSNANYYGRAIGAGRHVIKATPYTEEKCRGTAGKARTLRFNVDAGNSTDSCTNVVDCNDGLTCTIDTKTCDATTNFLNVCVNTPVTCPAGESCDTADGSCQSNEQLVPCVAVIDEDSSFNGQQQTTWNQFRSSYPTRPFCLLVPNPAGSIFTPANFTSDPRVTIVYDIVRDNGVASNAMDWVDLCGLDIYTSANVPFVGLFIDDSGSMREFQVAASRDLFNKTLAANGITIQKVVNGNENWILPFLTTLTPP